MSGVSLPVTRPSGRALIVGNPSSRPEPVGTLQRMGFGCAESDDPYAAMAELCRRSLVYRALVLSLSSLHREELGLISGVKRRFPHVDIWLTQTDGRQAALAEAMRLGADGLLSGEGLHRIAVGGTEPASFEPQDPIPLPVHEAPAQEPVGAEVDSAAAAPAPAPRQPAPPDDASTAGEPVLSADELRALLQEQPTPPVGGGE
jgi:hypothetical protein